MKKLIIFSLIFFSAYLSSAQSKKGVSQQTAIKQTIMNFLRWYKLEKNSKLNSYPLTQGGYPDTTTKERINLNGLDAYLTAFGETNLVSETFVNSLRSYFMNIDSMLMKMPVMKNSVKIPGMDIDFVLQTFEPEDILNNIDKSQINNLYILYNKALLSLHLAPHIDLLFILTKNIKGNWVIDYLGHDASDEKSFFRQ